MNDKKCRRFCKGCWDEVTDSMWCYCGESPLRESGTLTEEELAATEDGPRTEETEEEWEWDFYEWIPGGIET